MMKEKGYTLHNQNKSAERSSKNKNSNNGDKENSSKVNPNYNEDNDFNFKDDDLKKEDEVFKIERDQMIKEFKEAVKYILIKMFFKQEKQKLMEAIKLDNPKK